MTVSESQLNLFRSLFKGREDVFAKRWIKADKAGYSPGYDIDWIEFERHKSNGGTFSNYPNKAYSKLTNDILLSHFVGDETIGIYPLLPNNTSWFLSIDFDEHSWQTDVVIFYGRCQSHNIPAFIERSRSGNGGHVWIFFDVPIPAHQSRAIAQSLLKESGLLNKSQSNSFDRLFPNQDFLSGKGLGNLIALPLQGKTIKEGNSCFVDPLTLELIENQWEFLSRIERVSLGLLNRLFEKIREEVNLKVIPVLASNDDEIGFHIILRNNVTVFRAGMPLETMSFLRQKLKVNNTRFFIKKATGQSTHGIKPCETSLIEDTHLLSFPRGFIGPFLRYCRTHQLNYNFEDQRLKLPEVSFNPLRTLRLYQQPAFDVAQKKDFGVIVLPPGSGKTIIGLSIIADRKQPALIIVHRRQLFDQWLERIQSFLGIPRYKIGRITGGRVDIGEHITLAMIQSLHMPETLAKVEKSFGLVIVDECHHTPSDTYMDVLLRLQVYYVYGLTATAIRKSGNEQLIFDHLGELIYEMPAKGHEHFKREVVIHVRDTDFRIPFDTATDEIKTLLQILIHDHERNTLITDDVLREVDRSRSVLVITERKSHLDILNQYLKQNCETIVLSGDDSEHSRKTKIRLIEEGRFQVLITTGQFLGEGIDIDALDCLMLAYPCSFEGKLVQYLGRVQRGDITPVIYDYRDLQIAHLEKMFRQRNNYYNKLGKAGLIKIFEEYLLTFEEDRFYFGNSINALPITALSIEDNIECFKIGIVWKIRVLKFDEKESTAFCEILDYNANPFELESQLKLPLLPIEHIKFRTVDTAGLLRSVVFKKMVVNPRAVPEENRHLFEKTVKVPFKKLRFDNGFVIAPFYFSPLRQDVKLNIHNDVIRPEFGAVVDYFVKALKTKTISVTTSIKYSKQSRKISSIEAKSEEIVSINAELIESVRFEFVKSRIIKYRQQTTGQLQTLSQLKEQDNTIGALINDEASLLNYLLQIETARHYLQLKYLSGLHESNILKLRFSLQPFSFLFLLSGNKQYHIVWETLDTEEATYLWHVEKSKSALRLAIGEIEIALTEMKTSGRQEYLKNPPNNFSRIIHDYTDLRKGFVDWKGTLDERLI